MIFEEFCSILEELLYKVHSRINTKNNGFKICIAVSGGIDSMALLALTHKWQKVNYPNFKIYAVTIDHNLRSNSANDTLFVNDFCNKKEIYHKTLVWNHSGIKTGIQEKARKARYKLIHQFCKENHIDIILTAHHFDDNLEQLLMSISRGSDISSYIIPDIRSYGTCNILRPLMKFEKYQLENFLEFNNIAWAHDESNDEEKYLRNKIRPIASLLKNISEISRIKTTFKKIKLYKECNAEIVDKEIQNSAQIKFGYIKLDLSRFFAVNYNIQISILKSLLQTVGIRNKEIRLNSLDNLLQKMKEKASSTLCGTQLFYHNNTAILLREFAKDKAELKKLDKNLFLWDKKYEIFINFNEFKDCYDNIQIRTLTANELNNLIKDFPNLLEFDISLSRFIKKRIVKSIPCVVSLEKVLAIPHIYYYDESIKDLVKFTYHKTNKK